MPSDMLVVESLSDRLATCPLKLPYPIVGDALEIIPEVAKTVEQGISKTLEKSSATGTKEKRKDRLMILHESARFLDNTMPFMDLIHRS